MLRVYEKKLTAADLPDALATNGLGLLTHPLESKLRRVVNGDQSLTLTYPLDAPNAGLLLPERLICVDDGRSEQLYRIERRSPKSTRSGRVIEIEAPHIAYDLAHKMIENIETKEDPDAVDGIDARAALTQLLRGTGFAVGEVTVDLSRLDYLDILQKDVMSCLKEQLLDLWGGELVFDNFTIHLLSAMGEDRRYPIRDGRNIEEITVTEDYAPVVTRLHIRGYENANIEDINGGKDYIDSDLIGSYSHIREGYADFSDEDDPRELLRLGKEKLAELEVPEITYDIKLAEMRGSVQYAAYRRLEEYGLGDTAVLHSDTIDRDVILRCSELETDALTGRNLTVKLGNADQKLMSAITAGASASDRLARVLDAHGYLQAEKIAGRLNLVRIKNLEAEIVNILTAHIGEMTVDAAKINDLAAEVARIVQAKIGTLEVDWGSIDRLSSAVARIAKSEIGTADISWAKIKDLVADRQIITQGTAGELYIAKLAVTEANLVSLSVGQLMVKGADGAFYSVSVGADGQIKTEKKSVVGSDIADQTIHGGEKLIDGTITAAKINAQDVFADNAIIRSLIAANLDVDQLFSREATIGKINALDLLGNGSIRLMVQDQNAALEGKAEASDVEAMRQSILEQTENALTLRFQQAMAATDEVNQQLMQVMQDLGLYFRFAEDGLWIGRQGSDFKTRITDERLSFLQGLTEVAYISNRTMHITDAEITQTLRVGNLQGVVEPSGAIAWNMVGGE